MTSLIAWPVIASIPAVIVGLASGLWWIWA